MPRRTLLYLIFLLFISSAIYLPLLSRYPVSGDEQIYAMCVDNMRDGNSSWVYPSAYPGESYFQKPPLYMWLSAATSRFFAADNPAQYRVWSAIFGVLVVVGTCYLGARLYNLEVGLVAGLLLCANDSFVRNHGVETGTFDTGLTLACLICFLIYCSWANGKVGAIGWVMIGFAAGIATLLKPMFGLLPIGLLAMHGVFFLRSRPFNQRIVGPIVAIVIAALCSSWWYLLQYHHFGQQYIDVAWRQNVIARVAHGIDARHVQPWFYYPLAISKSSIAFVLAVPAIVYVLLRTKDGNNKFVSFVAISWVVLFSLSVSKYLHYVYPAMPLISVAIAVMLVEIGERLRNSGADIAACPSRNVTAISTFCVVPILVTLCGVRLGLGMSAEARRFYDPWRLYQQFKPAIDSGAVSLIEFGLPKAESQWEEPTGADLEEEDVFYLSKMPAKRIENPEELTAAIQRPSIVFMPRAAEVGTQMPAAHEPLDGHTRRVAIRTFHLDELLQPRRGSGWFDWEIEHDEATQKFVAQIQPPIEADAILNVIIRGDCEGFSATVSGKADQLRVHHAGSRCVLTLDLDSRQISPRKQTTIEIVAPAGKAFAIEDVKLQFEPHTTR